MLYINKDLNREPRICACWGRGGGLRVKSSLSKDLKDNFPVIHKQRHKHRAD